MKITVHTKGIKGSKTIEEGESPDALFAVVLEIDGLIIDRAIRVRIDHKEENLAEVIAVLVPSELEEIHHTEESWNDLFARQAVE